MKRGKKNAANDPYQQILSRLGNIEHKVDSIDETNAFALRAEAAKHENTVKQIFRHGKRRAQVYLAADGTRGVIEIAEYLGMKPPNVSLELRILKEQGLLEFTGSWAKKAIDRSLRISQYLCKEYGLRPDGRLKSGK
ncbi:MAG: ArsR family transcriptional regulator [Candidatus Acidiferrales bacterium]